MIIYGDLVAALNFLVDFLLLLATDRLAGYPLQCWKAALAATLGGGYGLLCIMPGFHFMGNVFWRIVVLGGMGAIAFGFDSSTIRRCVLFVLLSMALGGIASGIGNGGFLEMALSALSLCLMCMVGFRCRAGREVYLPVEITYGEKTVRMTALADTGNTLRDPVSGRDVLVVGVEVAETLLGLSDEDLKKPIETMVRLSIPGVRLIPYSAVGQPGAMLLGIQCDDVKVKGQKVDVIVAFAPQRLGQGREYQALVGGIL